MLFRVAAVAAVVLVSSASAFADAGDDKLQLFKDIQAQVHRYTYFTIFDNVEAAIDDDGVVLLSGSVTRSFKKNDIVKRVAQVDGVTRVDDAIDVLPVLRSDSQVRYRVARAIYGNWAQPVGLQHRRRRCVGDSRRYPPVHIVVDRGDVTLKGVVNNEVDKALAGSLAWQFGTQTVTNELQTVGEAKAELELLD